MNCLGFSRALLNNRTLIRSPSSSRAAKSLLLSNQRSNDNDDNNNDDSTSQMASYNNDWNILNQAIDEIFEMRLGELSFEELHRIAYNLVLNQHAAKLYTDIAKKFTNRIKSHCMPVLEKYLNNNASEDAASKGESSSSQQEERSQFLSVLTDLYADYKRAARIITDLLMYLNANILDIRDVTQGKTIIQRSIELFYTSLVSKCKTQLKEELLRRITMERNGQKIDQKLMATATVMLKDMDCYDEVLEKPLLQITQLYYQDLAEKWSKECSVPDYLEKVYDKVQEESNRVSIYLQPKTGSHIDTLIREHMVTKHMSFILENPKQGFVQLLQENQVEHLSRMYFLFSFSEKHLKEMVTRFEKYIFETGRDYVTDAANLHDPIAFINGILQQKEKYDVITEKAFQGDQLFIDALNNGFSHFADGNLQKRIAEFLSMYLDHAMRHKTEDPNFPTLLNCALSVFQYLHDKDVFENYYKIHLSKRLLFSGSSAAVNKMVSADDGASNPEMCFISKLKKICGYSFVAKIEGMFNDMRLSRKSHEKFLQHRAYKENIQPLNIDFFVNVLTSSFWPTYTMSRAILPPPMQTCTKAFTEYYREMHGFRQLTWKKNLGDGVMIARFPLSKHELVVSTYQMILLMLFNKVNELTYEEIKEQTNMPEKDLKRNLMMLFLGKHKLLAKEPKTKSIKPGDVFKWNALFKSSQVSIKMSGQVIKESKEKDEKESSSRAATPTESTNQSAGKSTKKSSAPSSLVKAGQLVVKYVKQNGSIDYKSVCQHLRDSMDTEVPTPIQIKKIVDNLIDKELIRRDAEDRKLLHWNQ